MQIPVKITSPEPLQDRLRRPLRELRMSVIDRCNFRCTYCMPADSLNGRGIFLPLAKLLTDHEIEDLIKTFVELGVRKIRITGGEPLVRPGLPGLVERLAAIPALEDIALTTNGVMLPRLAEDLAEAGLADYPGKAQYRHYRPRREPLRQPVTHQRNPFQSAFFIPMRHGG